MVFFSQQMLQIAVELALHDPLYEGFVVKFFEHTMWISGAMDRIGTDQDELTCVAFGGPDLTNLYITSASVGLSQNEIQKCHTAGDIFCLSSVAQRMPTHSFGRN